jgi:hypothetical protein
MTTLLDASPSNVLEVLRGERATRPLANTSAAIPFRLRLETELKDLVAHRPNSEPIVIRASTIHRTHVDVSDISALAQLRGILVAQALRLMSAGLVFESPFEESLLSWRSDVGDNPLTQSVDQLDADERARLATDVTAHCVTLRRTLGVMSPSWLPRTSLRAHQRLAGGRVILRDVIDLMVGTTTSDVASVVLLDITTAPLDERAASVLGYHALMQTLRTSVAPLRSSLFSTATGELLAIDIDAATLNRAVDEVIDAVRAKITS